jgi:hypothetical protein
MNGGALLDLDGASVKQPATSSDGTKTYVW